MGGLKTAPRSGDIIRELSEKRHDFLFLQETHLAEDKIGLLKTGFPNSTVYFSPGGRLTAGVAIVDRLGVEPTHIDIDTDGRYVILSFMKDKRQVTLINIYAPSGVLCSDTKCQK